MNSTPHEENDVEAAVFEDVPLAFSLDRLQFAGLQVLADKHGYDDVQREVKRAIEQLLYHELIDIEQL